MGKEPAQQANVDKDSNPASEAPKPGVPLAEREPMRSSDKPKVKRGLLPLAKELIARYNDNECAIRAQALSFVGIVSLVPLMLCCLAGLSFMIRDPLQAAEYLRGVITRLLPGQEAARAADDFIRQANIVESARTLMQGKWWAIILGVGSLVWAALSLVVSATSPMNAAWEVKETRGFVRLRMICLGVLLATGILFILSFLPTSGPNFVRNLHIPWLGLPQPVPDWVDALFELLAWGIDISMFVLLYRILPNVSISWRAALFGGAITGFLWELFKKGFAIYLSHFGASNKAYGAMGGAFLLISWIYYSCNVLLIGPILCKMYHEHCEEGGVAQKAA
jgi:membrane protein